MLSHLNFLYILKQELGSWRNDSLERWNEMMMGRGFFGDEGVGKGKKHTILSNKNGWKVIRCRQSLKANDVIKLFISTTQSLSLVKNYCTNIHYSSAFLLSLFPFFFFNQLFFHPKKEKERWSSECWMKMLWQVNWKKRGHHEEENTTLELIIRSLGYSNIHRQPVVKAGDLHNVTDDEYILIIIAGRSNHSLGHKRDRKWV